MILSNIHKKVYQRQLAIKDQIHHLANLERTHLLRKASMPGWLVGT